MDRQKLIDLGSKHFACVYKLVFPDGRVYVGKSKDVGKRVDVYKRKTDGAWASETNSELYEAIRGCGIEDVEVEVLFRVGGASGVDWEKDLDYALGIVERRWIIELKSSDPAIGYNKTDGGEMFGIRGVERVVDVVKKNYVYEDVIVPRQKQENGVRVVAYDINGDYYGEWPSRVAFTREVIGSGGTLGFGQWRKGFIIYRKEGEVVDKVESYAEYIERTKAAEIEAKRVLEEKVGKVKIERSVRLQRGVVMCGKDYKEVERYANIRDAADATGLRYSSIYAVLKKGHGLVSGYHFYYTDEFDASKGNALGVKVLRNKEVQSRVQCLDKRGNVVAEYNDINCASKDTALEYSAIANAAFSDGKVEIMGHYWRFVDIDDDKKEEKDAIPQDMI